MVKKIDRRLQTWVAKGFISEEQAHKIRHHESNSSRPMGIYGIVGIGATTVATGVVSLVAANWDVIPPGVKLFLYFLIQAGLGLAFLRLEKKKGVWREGVLTLFSFCFVAGIGLVAQIYHLRGELWQSLLFWNLLTLGPLMLAETALLNNVWVVVVSVALQMCASSFQYDGLKLPMRISLAASIPILVTALGFWAEAFDLFSRPFRKATVFWGIGTVLLLGTPWINFLWYHLPSFSGSRLDLERTLFPPWIAIVIAAVGAAMRLDIPKKLRVTTVLLLLVFGVYGSVPTLGYVTQVSQTFCQIAGAGGFILVAALAATAAALADYKRLFDLASFVIALRFVVIYFEVFGSLAYTGLGLIASGLVILGVAYFWHKYRKESLHWIGGGK